MYLLEIENSRINLDAFLLDYLLRDRGPHRSHAAPSSAPLISAENFRGFVFFGMAKYSSLVLDGSLHALENGDALSFTRRTGSIQSISAN